MAQVSTIVKMGANRANRRKTGHTSFVRKGSQGKVEEYVLPPSQSDNADILVPILAQLFNNAMMFYIAEW